MRIVLTCALTVGLVLALVGCQAAEQGTSGEIPPATDPAAGTSPAPPSGSTPGITELDDGRISVEGWLAYVDLEGGFYAIQDGPPSDTPGVEVDVTTVMVIANSPDFGSELESMSGAYVTVIGKALDGASVRMAGPEMLLESIRIAQ